MDSTSVSLSLEKVYVVMDRVEEALELSACTLLGL
jgi:hypothetical protein